MSDQEIFSKFMYDRRFSGWKHSKKVSSLKKLETFYQRHFENKEVLLTFDKRSKRYAQIILSYEKHPLRPQKYFCTFDYREKSSDAEKFIFKELKKIIRKYDSLLIEVPTRYKKAMKLVSSLNYQVDAISTVTSFSEAYKEIKNRDVTFTDSFKFRKMKTKDIESSVRIMKGEFKKNPHYGAEIATKAFCDFCRDLLRADMKTDHGHYVIENNTGKVLGSFSAFISNPDSFWGVKAGLSFSIDSSLQRKGYLKYMYKVLFDHMKKHKVRVFTGSTTHPAVIKESMRLKRKPFAALFVRDKRCLRLSEFEDFLKI